jgi:hypothetical protein
MEPGRWSLVAGTNPASEAKRRCHQRARRRVSLRRPAGHRIIAGIRPYRVYLPFLSRDATLPFRHLDVMLPAVRRVDLRVLVVCQSVRFYSHVICPVQLV